MSASETYGYAELADRIEQVLGVRPSTSTLRAEATAARRSQTTKSRPRLTAGLPAPLPSSSRTAPARFLAGDVEDWLRTHPRVRSEQAADDLRAQLRDEAIPVQQAVAHGRALGLSWRAITELLREERGDERTMQAVFKAYRGVED